MSKEYIVIAGAREHNLKNIDVKIPRDALTVITGLSGSGKSSLAFDTIYAEGQRRYVESLSAYARQFLNQMQKPDIDHIEGLSPAISIEQRTAGSNPRSIVATSTEVHDYLRLLFANIGKPHCPKCGSAVSSQSAEEIVELLLKYPVRTKVTLLAPLVRGRKGAHDDLFKSILQQGFVRARVDGELCEVEEPPKLAKTKVHTIEAVVDRLIITNRIRSRLTDSLELALKHGHSTVIVLLQEPGKDDWQEVLYSERFACAKCGISFEELQPRSFSFNSPYGACPTCSGLGKMLVFDEGLLVPDESLSINDGAVYAWRRGGRRLIIYYKNLLRGVCKHYGIDMDKPFDKISAEHRQILFHGSDGEDVELGYWRGGSFRKLQKPFEGFLPNLMRRYEKTDSDYTRQRLRKYMSRTNCESCHGARLKPEVMACTIQGKSIVDVVQMTIANAAKFFAGLDLIEQQMIIGDEILKEISRRLNFMVDVGLDYLTLDRESGTLSGGESQRIRLATQIGSGLVGVLYVLDEPTIGLHLRDNLRLVKQLKMLRDVGNTVIIVEHDEQMIREADYIIDLGPGAGRHGGEVVCQGSLKTLMSSKRSVTARFLSKKNQIHVPTARKEIGKSFLKIHGAAANNLKNIDVAIPLGLFVCVSGVSGSGKSTLIDNILKRALFRHFNGSRERSGKHDKITGLGKLDKVIVIDQSPIGRTPRSNPATYTGAFTDIRKMFAQTPEAKVRGYGPGRFSFNVKGGRCETCKGDGLLRLEMHFLPDVYVTCEQCRGARYNRETLDILYNGRNIQEVLSMTINEALEYFTNIPSVERKLRTLSEVGLGYLQLGQSATTLSGGEAQRVKLSSELSKRATGKTLYLLDEPTTGLHFADIQKLMQVLLRLRDSGNTVVVIEHNLDVIKTADYVIDLGPEGGDKGGMVLAEGTPEDIAKVKKSYTGQFLKEALK